MSESNSNIVNLIQDQAAMEEHLKVIEQELGRCMAADRHNIEKLIRDVRNDRLSRKLDVNLKRLQNKYDQSHNLYKLRESKLPHVDFNVGLPIDDKIDDIQAAIREHQIIIVAGDTGSGKSTQLPKICLAMNRGVSGYIGHTQPRRIAARSIAKRLCDETDTVLGGSIGYKVRFMDKVGAHTHIKLMTDGILLAELQSDRYLNKYDTLIIDEAHERSLNIDFLLGYLTNLLPRRPDLKVIITSATIDTDRFSKHFNDAPIVNVEGRSFPVEVKYLADHDTDLEDNLPRLVRKTIEKISEKDRHGDILVFLSGESEIRQSIDALRRPPIKNTNLLPLYARLSHAAQNAIFEKSPQRKIILATNIAETSLTIPGIRYVIDTGNVRMSRYSFRSKVQRLPIEKVSQASANQRKGRCGRVSEGVCYRLYSQDDFEQRPEFTDPEIKRTNLASVILQMEASGLGDIRRFPFIDPPDSRYINDGYKLLFELLAVDEHNKITKSGRSLARLPVDPRLGKMILAADSESCLYEILIIVSALGIPNIRERTINHSQSVDDRHELFNDKQSDFLSYVSIWNEVRELKSSALRKFCRENHLSFLRILEWRDVYKQLATIAKESKYTVNSEPASYNQIHRSILSGICTLVGFKDDDEGYQAPRNTRFIISNRSVLHKHTPKWIMSETLIQTTRLYAFNNAKIYPKWIESVAGHLVIRDYYDADWDIDKGRVIAFERCFLYGLALHTRRKVDYGRINTSESRRVFIQKALVEHQLRRSFNFYKHNLAVLQQSEQREAKCRTRSIAINDDALFGFYSKQIPETVCSTETLTSWLRANPSFDELLKLTDSDINLANGTDQENSNFPDTLCIRGHNLTLAYLFDPSQDNDGITITIPNYLLHEFEQKDFDCLVPGLLREKIIGLIKSLPKSLRTSFIPAADYADSCLSQIVPGESLIQQVTYLLRKQTGIDIPSECWRVESLSKHLSMTYKVIDDNGIVISEGKEFKKYQRKNESVGNAGVNHSIERDNLSHWDFENLPEQVQMDKGQHSVTFYPALVDKIDSVSISLCRSKQTADSLMTAGQRRLFILQNSQKIKYLKKNIPHIKNLTLWYSNLGDSAELKESLVKFVVDQCLFENPDVDYPMRTRDVFEQQSEVAEGLLVSILNRTGNVLKLSLETRWNIMQKLASDQYSDTSFFEDIEEQFEWLFQVSFLSVTSYQWLERYPAYLKAVSMRMEKYTMSPTSDLEKQNKLESYQQQYSELLELNADNSSVTYTDIETELTDFRWMLEEFRISLFAQGVKTRFPISAKRLDNKLQALHKSFSES